MPVELGAGLHELLDAERAVMPRDVYEVGSMLSYDERLLCHWAARTGPDGAIVDLGSFLGGSTLALASGAQDRGAVVHAYDRFVMTRASLRTWLLADVQLGVGDSTVSVFERNIARVAGRVVVHAGDVEQEEWSEPIGVLFVDITKSWATADKVWRTFLPALEPGGLLIQQDLVHWGHPWCAVLMEHLAGHFEYLGWAWYSSAAYRCVTAVDAPPVPMLDRFSCEEMLSLLDRAASRFAEPVASSVRLSGVFVLAAYGRVKDAERLVSDARGTLHDSELPHIEQAFAILDGWLAGVRAGYQSPLSH